MKKSVIIFVCLVFLVSFSSYSNLVSANIDFHQSFDSESAPYPGTSCTGVDDLYYNSLNYGPTGWYPNCMTELRTDVNDRSSPSTGKTVTFVCDWVDCSERASSQRANMNICQPTAWGASSPACADGGDYNDGTEYWVGMSYYIPVNNGFEEGGGVMMFQFLGGGSDHNIRLSSPSVAYGSMPNYQIGYRQDNSTSGWGKDSGISMSSTEGTWLDVVVQWVPYTYDNTNATIKMWINGQNVLDKVGKQTFKTSSGGPWFQFILYNKGCYPQFDCLTNCKDADDGPVEDWRVLRIDEIRFTENTMGTKEYCLVAPPIWAAKPSISYPSNGAINIPSSFTATYSGYVDHRNDPQNCFSYTKTQIQIDEQGGDWSTPVYDSGEINAQTSNSISGLSSQQYQMRVRHESVRSGTSDTYWGEWSDTIFFTVGASTTNKTYTILKTSTPPTIDGNINEFANANSLTITNSNGNSATYKMLWDSNNLYIAAQGSDSQLAAIASERDGALWDDDAIELFFDTLNNGGIFLNSDDYKFFVNLLNTTRDSYFGGGGSSWNTIFNSAVTTSGTLNVAGNVDAGYTIEIAIPWSNWGVSVPVDSSVWGFDVSMDDRNDAGDVIQKAWSQTNVGNIPDEFGDVTFSSQFVSSGSVCKSLADSNSDGVISISELINYISQWKSGSVSITQLIDAIGKWKSGC